MYKYLIIALLLMSCCQPVDKHPMSPTKDCDKKTETSLGDFSKIDSHDIMLARQCEAASKEKRNEGMGRVDPLFINDDTIPKELRPPRTGSTEYDKLMGYMLEERDTEILKSIHIDVWSIMQIGLDEYVNMTIDDTIFVQRVGEVGLLSNGAMFFVPQASKENVTVALYLNDATLTRSFVPKS